MKVRRLAVLVLLAAVGACDGRIGEGGGVDALSADGPLPPPADGLLADRPVGDAGGPADGGGPPVDLPPGTDVGADAAGPADGGPPPADLGPAPVNLRIAVLSDLNGSYGSTTYESTVHGAVAHVTSTLRPDLVLVTGDMVAGQQGGLDYRAMWDGFHAAVSDPLAAAAIPLAVSPGNHDASGYAAFAGERDIFVDEWSQPARLPGVELLDMTGYPLRYSFSFRGALFVSLDATTIGPLAAEQRDWVAGQLAAGRDHAVKIVYGHVPVRPFTVGREEEILADDALEALLASEGVTALITGHHHGYYPGVSGGVRQISTPCLGGGPRPLIGTASASPRGLLTLEVVDSQLTVVEAYRTPDFTAPIARSDLPAELSYGPHRVDRDDLAGF